MERISFEDYFMLLAFLVSKRSPDLSTKHGAVLVNRKNQILGLGYNGFPRSCKDELLPQTRPDKYKCFIHSELSAILNGNSCLENSTLYVTGFPCVRCWGLIIQTGIKKVVYGCVKSKHEQSIHLQDNKDNELINLMLDGQGIEIVEWKPKDINLLYQEINSISDFVSNY